MFSEINFTWPATFSAENANAAGKLANANAEINTAKTRLTAAPDLALVNNPIAATCNGSLAALTALNKLLANEVSSFCVHPWTQGVGQGDSHNRYLSPANAVVAVANKFSDVADVNKPKTVVDAICVLLTAASYGQLAETITQFCTVFPDAQLRLCQRRAQQLSTIEKDKVILPDAAGNAFWRPGRLAAAGRGERGCSLVGERFAHAVGYEAGGVSPDQELINLATKKQQQLSHIAAAISSFAATFSGGSGRGVFISAKTPEQIKNQLAANSLGHDEPLACCVVYSGVPGSLGLLREMLGL